MSNGKYNCKVCINCHYMFNDKGDCKCRLNLDGQSRAVRHFMRRQQVIGYRVCQVELKPDAPVTSDDEILERIEKNAALLRAEIDRIF